MSPKSWIWPVRPGPLSHFLHMLPAFDSDPCPSLGPFPRTPIFSMTHQADGTPAARCNWGAGVRRKGGHWNAGCDLMVILGLSPFGLSPLPSRLLGSYFFLKPAPDLETFYATLTPVIFVTIQSQALLPLPSLCP